MTESIMDQASGGENPTQDVVANEGASTTNSGSPSWFYAENMPGVGDRPEWLKEKYKTAADQAKAYADLEKKLGAFTGAPDEYDLTLDGDEFKDIQIQKENPVLQEFLGKAKEMGVSQQFVSEMLKSYAKMQALEQPNLDKEMEKLGVNGQQDLKILGQWASNNFTKEELATFKGMVRTAEEVRIFEKIRRMMTKAETVPSNNRSPVESADKIKRLIHDPRYESDPTFREEVRAKLANVLGVDG